MEKQISSEKTVLEIPRRLVDKRLDVAVFDLLQKKLPTRSLSRGSITRLINERKISLNGRETIPDHLVKLHDTAEVSTQDLFTPAPILEPQEDIGIPILYEDEVIIVINKPEGIQIHPARRGINMKTIAHWIITKYPKLRGIGEDPLRPGIVHRLDRETSGVLVIAKTEASFKSLKELFQKRAMEKTYIALVYGHMEALEGQINKPLIRHSGELKRFAVETQYVPEGAREALTLYRVIARYAEFDLLSVTPKTGRTHQIRVHLASLGNPIVGDKLYTSKSLQRGDKFFSQRQLLHAFRLKFDLFSKKYTFGAPLPPDFQSVLKDIDPVRHQGRDSTFFQSEATGAKGPSSPIKGKAKVISNGVDETSKTVYDSEALKSLLVE